MTTMARRDPADKAKIDAIEKKLLANPEIAKLIDELGTSTTDANDLVRGMLQASITRGLNAEMDAHLGYEPGDRAAKATAETDNHRNGTYPKTVDSNYGPVNIDVPRDRAGTFTPTMAPQRLQAANRCRRYDCQLICRRNDHSGYPASYGNSDACRYFP